MGLKPLDQIMLSWKKGCSMADERSNTLQQPLSLIGWIIYWIVGIIALAFFLGAIWMPSFTSIWNWLWGGGPPFRPIQAPFFVTAVWLLKSAFYYGYLVGVWLFPVAFVGSVIAESGDTLQQKEETKEAQSGGMGGRTKAALILMIPAIFALLWLQRFFTNLMYACVWGDACQIFLTTYGLG